LDGWLYTEMGLLAHPSTNRAQSRATTLIDTNGLPLGQNATRRKYYIQM